MIVSVNVSRTSVFLYRQNEIISMSHFSVYDYDDIDPLSFSGYGALNKRTHKIDDNHVPRYWAKYLW